MPGDWAAPLEGCAAEPEKNVAICPALVGGHRAPPPTLEPSVLISLSAGCCRFAPVCCLSAARPSRTQPPCLRQKREHSRNGTVAARVFSRSVSSNVIMLEVVEGFVFFHVFFRAAIASGVVTVILRTFSAPLPKRVVLNAFARRMRL